MHLIFDEMEFTIDVDVPIGVDGSVNKQELAFVHDASHPNDLTDHDGPRKLSRVNIGGIISFPASIPDPLLVRAKYHVRFVRKVKP
jgi:hypothetical protein